ncbi:hypothetical protein [Accumulibacter sp.]|uniref:hypothetical protein n=1 Tax=Accumulibacter sp. TaxID=2053492 RepID=UPI0028C49C2A|nr:hypothetical protein [Accumulibacter sp.]
MISEKEIAKQFNGLWNDTLPLLTPQLVGLFNAVHSDDLTEFPGGKFKRIAIGANVEKHDLVAELSFQVAKLSVERGIPIHGIGLGTEDFKDAYRNSTAFLRKYASEDSGFLLNAEEISEALTIASQYEGFFSHVSAKTIEFSPRISGAGYLGSCCADLSVDDTLYEIKTVSRNIAGKDIRQLILYLALQYSTGKRRWLYAGFFNPRKCTHYRFSVDHLMYRTSGGRSTSEVFADIVDFLSNRGIEIDSIF